MDLFTIVHGIHTGGQRGAGRLCAAWEDGMSTKARVVSRKERVIWDDASGRQGIVEVYNPDCVLVGIFGEAAMLDRSRARYVSDLLSFFAHHGTLPEHDAEAS